MFVHDVQLWPAILLSTAAACDRLHGSLHDLGIAHGQKTPACYTDQHRGAAGAGGARTPPAPCPVPSHRGYVFTGCTVSRFDCPRLKRVWEEGVALPSHKTAWVSRSLLEAPGPYSRIWIVAVGTVSRHGPENSGSHLCSERRAAAVTNLQQLRQDLGR